MRISHPNRVIRTARAAMMAVAVTVGGAAAQAAGIDPAATAALQRMTDYLGGLQQFSVHTQNDIEDLLDSGQRVDYGVAVSVTVKRPNKLHAQRQGELSGQSFYYDGKTLSLYIPADRVYATVAAPGTIEAMLGFAQSALGLVIPAADLMYRDAYPLLMEGVTSARVIDKTDIGGVSCSHLAFSRPGVDFQIWIADSGAPLPCKYVVTDTGTPALLSVSMVMSDWAVNQPAPADEFSFVPPAGTQAVPFMRLDANGPLSQ